MPIHIKGIVGPGGLLDQLRKRFETSLMNNLQFVGNTYHGMVISRKFWNPVVPTHPDNHYTLSNFIKAFQRASDQTPARIGPMHYVMRFGDEEDLTKILERAESGDTSRNKPPYPWWRLFEFGAPGVRHGGPKTSRFVPIPGKGRAGAGEMFTVTTGTKPHPGVMPLGMMSNPFLRWALPEGVKIIVNRTLWSSFWIMGGLRS